MTSNHKYLVQRWCEASNTHYSPVTQGLCEDTDRLAASLTHPSNLETSRIATELLTDFKNQSIEKATQLAKWLGENAFKNGEQGKAFHAFHQLFWSILKTKHLQLDSKEAETLNYIQSFALRYATPPFDVENTRKLMQRWYTAAASGDQISTDARISLYEDTQLLAEYLEAKQAAGQKITALATVVLNAVEEGDAQQLIEWLRSHTIKRGSEILGAYSSFQYLSNSLAPFKSAVLNRIETDAVQKVALQTPNLLKQICELEIALLDTFPLKSIAAFKNTNLENRSAISNYFIHLMNRSENSYRELAQKLYRSKNINEIEPIIDFLGKENLSKLSRLSLSHCKPSDIEKICAFKTLKSLDLSCGDVDSDQELSAINKLNISSLENLSITNSNNKHLPLGFLQHLPNLSTLSILAEHIVDKDIIHLQSCKKIKNLNLALFFQSSSRKQLCQTLQSLPELQTLSISGGLNGHWMNELDLTFIDKIPNLTTLKLSNIKFINKHNLINTNNLQIVELVECVNVDFSCLKEKKIKKLIIESQENLNTGFLTSLKHLTHLEISYIKEKIKLEFSDENTIKYLALTRVEVEDFNFISKLVHLNKILISGCQELPESHLLTNLPIKKITIDNLPKTVTELKLLKGFLQAEELTIRSCRGITNLDFISEMPELRVLRFNLPMKLNLKDINNIARKFPKLVYIEYCKPTTEWCYFIEQYKRAADGTFVRV
jgi:hypothetical protein